MKKFDCLGTFPRRKREITLEEGDVLAIDLGNGTRIVLTKDDGEVSVKKQHQRVVWEDDPVEED